jgi:hypothetical protein
MKWLKNLSLKEIYKAVEMELQITSLHGFCAIGPQVLSINMAMKCITLDIYQQISSIKQLQVAHKTRGCVLRFKP